MNEVLSLHCDLDLENDNPILTQNTPPELMMMYHPLKFDCKKIGSSVDMVETVTFDYISPHYDLDFEDSKPIFVHNTLAHDGASLK